MLPPVDADLPGLVNRRDQQSYLDREQFDVEQVDPDVARDHDALVQDALEDVGQVRRLLAMAHRVRPRPATGSPAMSSRRRRPGRSARSVDGARCSRLLDARVAARRRPGRHSASAVRGVTRKCRLADPSWVATPLLLVPQVPRCSIPWVTLGETTADAAARSRGPRTRPREAHRCVVRPRSARVGHESGPGRSSAARPGPGRARPATERPGRERAAARSDRPAAPPPVTPRGRSRRGPAGHAAAAVPGPRARDPGPRRRPRTSGHGRGRRGTPH